ncbi:MAG: dTDP-4-dehydrorhamnose reductase [Flavobacteriaceae bacterium]
MRILITGSNGQLGSEIESIYSTYKNIECIFKDLPELDICDAYSLNALIIDERINAVINCAAYTAVDEAEENIEIARRVNATGVSNLIEALDKVNGKLIHISTDYVFDGNNSQPYRESDQVCPIGVYGETKRAGELAVINSEIDAIVIRTSWLYSAFGNNFLKTMLRLGRDNESLNVISDQIGTPTYAKNLAKTCLDILLISDSERISKKGKIYHYSNKGVASWYDFAVLIMELAELKCKINPIQTKDYPTSAKRPHYSVLSKKKIKTDFKVDIPNWKESLKECIIKLKQ